MISMGKPVFDTVEETLDYAALLDYDINRGLAIRFGEEFDAVYNAVGSPTIE